MMGARIYTDKDASLDPLREKSCAVIGFGSQGRAHALNLRDSGIRVLIGLPSRSKSRPRAKRDGFVVTTTERAVGRADLIFLALPDSRMPVDVSLTLTWALHERWVALKLLVSGRDHAPETLDRFVREGQLAAALSHPRSTFVFGAGEHEGQPYIVMELMPGRTLKDLVDEEGPLEVYICPEQDELDVVVRDQGLGIQPHRPEPDAGVQGVGLSLIQALTDRVEVRGSAGERSSGGGALVGRSRRQAWLSASRASASISRTRASLGRTPLW